MENETCPDSRKSEIPIPYGGKWMVSGCKKRWISKFVGVEIYHVQNSGKMDLQICLWQMRHVRISKTLIFQVCLCGIDHVQMSGKVTLQICWDGNGICPDSSKDECPNLFGGKQDNVLIPERVNFHVGWNGNRACTVMKQNGFTRQFVWKWVMSGCQKEWISKGREHSGCQKRTYIYA